MTIDRTVNQRLLYTECTCVNKLITGKQTIRGCKLITWITNRKTAQALWNYIYAGTHRISLSVLESYGQTQSHGERPVSTQGGGNAYSRLWSRWSIKWGAEYGSTTWLRRKGQYSNPPGPPFLNLSKSTESSTSLCPRPSSLFVSFTHLQSSSLTRNKKK